VGQDNWYRCYGYVTINGIAGMDDGVIAYLSSGTDAQWESREGLFYDQWHNVTYLRDGVGMMVNCWTTSLFDMPPGWKGYGGGWHAVRDKMRSVGVYDTKTKTLLASGNIPPQQSFSEVRGGTYDRTMEADGLSRTYRVHLPTSYSPDNNFPLVIALHGGRDNGKGMEKLTGLSTLSDQKGFIVVYPDALEKYKYWNDGRLNDVDDIHFISSLIDELRAKYSINPGRIYVTGISNGASMTNRIGIELSQRITAIAPVAGTIGVKVAGLWKPSRPMPVIYFHGTDDPLAYYEGGSAGTYAGSSLSAEALVQWWAEKNSCAMIPKVLEIPQIVDDGTSVTQFTYTNVMNGAEVIFYKINGGGHGWPGSSADCISERVGGKTSNNINASELIWDFFDRCKIPG
jgi:polyhydroxybutyrate depolymerase